MKSDRRSFIKTASVVAAGTVLPFEAFSIGKPGISPNDKINVALVGGNSMGWSDLSSFLKNPEVLINSLGAKTVKDIEEFATSSKTI